MTTPSAPNVRRRGLPFLIAGAVVIGAVAGGVVVSRLDSNEPTPPPSATPTPTTAATPTPTTTGIGTGPSYQVEAGAGGTRVANADGKTPMGYPSTCEGAIAAATNYAAVLEGTDASSATPEGIATYNALIDEISPGAIPGAGMWQDLAKEERAQYADLFADAPLLWTSMPEVGAFRVVSCTPERSAEIDVVMGGELRTPASTEVEQWYLGQRVQLTWLNDWSPRDISILPGDESIGLLVSPNTFTRSLRDSALTGDLAQWQEYSNVPF